MNIHGHDHAANFRHNHINLASNVYHFRVFNLGASIKGGLLSRVENIHRVTIDNATLRKQEREEYAKYFGDKFARELTNIIHKEN